ncbi:MFS transporter [Streptomyces zagrosensis]|uniref:Putative MFS family arabinose efflux permease n=1 Tax=Streptomyces zagrosensis TaxID=1042984 RepID=A0A7W9QET7_9ACTN|nr:MFS transporter [Streptomyces zagrosensis]MBB5938930.1 putative MFS family arabinose efflux permease [Streptomyces zagrosensis]
MQKRYAMARYMVGATAARTGDEMSGPALLLTGLAATGSASAASALLAGITIAAAVGGPVFGVLIDRSARPGRLLAGALAGYAAALTVILLAIDHWPIGYSVLIAVGAGLLGPALSGGWTAQLPRCVTPDALPRAHAFDAMTFNGAGLVGPAAAGVIASLIGAPAAVGVSIALICLALPSAWTLPARRTRRPAAADGSVAADLGAGFRAIARVGPLARATATSVISCVGDGILIACCPLLGVRVLDGADRGAILLSVVAASALAANTLLARRAYPVRPDTLIWCAPLAIAGALALAATCSPVALICAMVIAGAAEGPQLTALFTVRHREAPARLRGQIFTTGASLKITGFAVGAAIAGPLATWSLPGALLTAAGFQIVAALVFAAMTRHPAAGSRTRQPSW